MARELNFACLDFAMHRKKRTLNDFFYVNIRKVRIVAMENKHKVQVTLRSPNEKILLMPQEPH
ncbi:MAG: hypothetical protein ACE5QW_07070 [Thermoplasmata archaeon]